jgi:two-component system cell cycle sensor histidine kinase/response regulator CckA
MASPTDVAPTPDDIETQITPRGNADEPARPGWRLTAYFAVLVAVVALAAAAASVYVYVQTDRDSRHAAEDRAQFAASTAAKQLAESIATLKATVAGLAATPNIEQAAAQPTCTLTFALGDLSRGHVDIVRPDGSVACSSRPRAGNKPLAGYAGADWLGKVGTTPVFLAPVPDSATGDRSAIAAVRSPGKAIVAAFMALEPVGHGLVNLYGAGDPVEFLITSRDGRRALTRSIDPGRWVGTSLAGTAFASTPARTDRRDVDGHARLYEEATVPGVGWRFYAGEDKAAALAAGDHLRKRQLAIILIGLALVVLATLAVYRRVVVPIRRLGARVRATTALVPPEPVPVSGPAEVRDLGEDVNGLIRSASDELHRREQAEDSTRASERSYRLLFENSPLSMWIHDAETMGVLAVNDAAVARYGYTREEFLGKTPAELVVPGDDADADGEEEAILGTVRHRRKDGREIKARIIAHSVTFDGRAARCVVAEDVGERERIETQLRQAQKMEAVGQLAGGVAHDFNNLLTVIAGYSGMARNRIGSGPGVRELAEIDRAAERATQLTQQLLTFSRQQVLNPVVLDLNEVVDAVTPMLSRLIGEDIEIGVLAGDDTPPLIADRGQIEQVIVNLAVNARDAMPDGGTLTIETRGVRLDERYSAEHAGVEPGHYACLSVTDTGVGIDETTQARIFEPFFTTKEVGEGTGLGLATVHGIVDQSGGHLEVYSEPGFGTSFKVYIPAAAGEAVVRADAQPQRPERLRGTETILVCEDDELVRILLQTMLTENGYRVLCASRPDEALSLAATDGSEIDLLVTDLIMPLMSGPELVERLEETRPGLHVLLLSGYPAETVRNRPLPEGSVFLQKPFDELSLLARIRELLDSEPQTPAAARHELPEREARI